MASLQEKADAFLALHAGDGPLLMPNAWDAGSAKVLASLGYTALATTSSGSAATFGRLDGGVGRDEAIASAAAIAAATDVPVSADLEDCFGADAAGIAETVVLARDAGLAGLSIEDFTRDDANPIFELDVAVERVRAAAAAAHGGDTRLVLTARAENLLHGIDDIDDTITRLQAYADAGADVLFAPGLRDLDVIRRVVDAVALPLNVLAWPGGPTVGELGDAGVARISVGGAFMYAALGALVEAAEELKGPGTLGYWDRAKVGGKAARTAFTT